jgi:hypothetical protein
MTHAAGTNGVMHAVQLKKLIDSGANLIRIWNGTRVIDCQCDQDGVESYDNGR